MVSPYGFRYLITDSTHCLYVTPIILLVRGWSCDQLEAEYTDRVSGSHVFYSHSDSHCLRVNTFIDFNARFISKTTS